MNNKTNNIDYDNNLNLNIARYLFQLCNIVFFIGFVIALIIYIRNSDSYVTNGFPLMITISILSSSMVSLVIWGYVFWLNFKDFKVLKILIPKNVFAMYRESQIIFFLTIIVTSLCLPLLSISKQHIELYMFYIAIGVCIFGSLSSIILYTISIEKIKSIMYKRKYDQDFKKAKEIDAFRDYTNKLSDKEYKNIKKKDAKSSSSNKKITTPTSGLV